MSWGLIRFTVGLRCQNFESLLDECICFRHFFFSEEYESLALETMPPDYAIPPGAALGPPAIFHWLGGGGIFAPCLTSEEPNWRNEKRKEITDSTHRTNSTPVFKFSKQSEMYQAECQGRLHSPHRLSRPG